VHGQSEVGTLQPVAQAAQVAKQLGAQLHVDAAQALGRLPLEPLFALADSVALSPHKAGGLRGTGLLFVREAGSRLRPLLRGGGQEHGLRPGTTSPALAAATALAIELAAREQPARAARMSAARTDFLRTLAASELAWQLLTPLHDSLPNTLLVGFPGIDGRNLTPALDLEGICVSQGSACSSGAPEPPPVLRALGLDEAAARTCVRISFGCNDDANSGATAAAAVVAVVARLQKKN
jgi:cysteine desulfurase